jgi:uncharacterized DUF497 family protein
MDIEWDETKRAANQAKHGVDFPAAARILEGGPLIFADERRDYGEARYVALGKLADRLLVVVFTLRGSAVRIISARKANAREVHSMPDTSRTGPTGRRWQPQVMRPDRRGPSDPDSPPLDEEFFATARRGDLAELLPSPRPRSHPVDREVLTGSRPGAGYQTA